jgi:hypothetical protein
LNSAADRNYTIRKEEGRLIFVTTAYRAEPDSVLHSGIYNREFSSALASAVVAGMLYVIAAVNTDSTLVRSLVFLVIFAGGFPLFRKFVFKESFLEVVFDTAGGKTEIYSRWIRKKLKETISLTSVRKISIETRKKEMENPDAVEFVEKISLQHGQVIPGFGKEKVLFLLKLQLADGSERTIYSDEAMQDVISAYDEIKEFLKI